MADIEPAACICDQLYKQRDALLIQPIRNRAVSIILRARKIRGFDLVEEKTAEFFRVLSSNNALSLFPSAQFSDVKLAKIKCSNELAGGATLSDEGG